MTNIQEWLNSKFPNRESKEKVSKLYIFGERQINNHPFEGHWQFGLPETSSLEGELEIKDLPKLNIFQIQGIAISRLKLEGASLPNLISVAVKDCLDLVKAEGVESCSKLSSQMLSFGGLSGLKAKIWRVSEEKEQELQAKDQTIQSKQQQITQLQNQIQVKEQNIQQKQNQLNQLNQEKNNWQNQLNQLKESRDTFQKSADYLRETLKGTEKSLEEKEAKLKPVQEELEEEKKAKESLKESHQQELKNRQEAYQVIQERNTELSNKLNSASQENSKLSEWISKLESVSGDSNAFERLKKELEEANSRVIALREELQAKKPKSYWWIYAIIALVAVYFVLG